ncbi:CapA family protein [Bacteroides acidifaciens]|uniref:CapA family protein n=1 Tax=Bacteroides acidifaciens TaxID=85831 RepID=UPI00214B49F0|nr:CapA family protein [Bacteroides acidifaciens]MCR1999159.1 CapA family protein [Bacteroides acidifaciens]
MRHTLFLIIMLLSLSCTSRSQARRDSIDTTLADSLSAIDSILPADTLRLLFVGDLMQHQGQINAARTAKGYDYSTCFEYVKEEINRADLAIANLEVTLGGKPYKGYPAFSAPDEFLTAIHNAGFNVLVTANNHSLDRGSPGLERTIQLIDTLKIPHAGTYINSEAREKEYPLLLEKNGFRIALLNYTYGTNGIPVTLPNIVNYIDTTIIAKDIETGKALKPDAIIACMHWGIEYQSLPDKEQKFLADWLLRKGVDHVIGSHPHVVQPIEVRTDSLTNDKHLIVYSLGNFISNMSARRTDGGLMVRMELVKDSTTRLNNCEYSLVWTARPMQSGKKNHQLLPINLSADSIPLQARNSLKIFTNDARTFFSKHNQGIKEYTFYKKK